MKKMSLILAALDSSAEIEDVLVHVQRQTIREDLELIVICDTLERLNDADGFVRRCADQLIESRAGDLADARVAGIRASTAPYIAILEDHCCPDAEWAAALLRRLEEGWTVVGPVFRPANPAAAVSQAVHLICYGQWLEPMPSGEAGAIAGHNSAYRRDVLLSRRDLASDMGTPVVMHADLRSQGHRFWLEGGARMSHWDPSRWSTAIMTMAAFGRAMGFSRAEAWSAPRRLLMALTMPALTTVRWARSLRSWARGRRDHRLVLWAPVPQLVLSAVWSWFECWGYVFPRPDAARALSETEHDRRRFLRPGEWPRVNRDSRV